MPKKQGRKPPKRPAPRPRVDDDLFELAAVLDDYRLENNANGWFTLPWRDGWNAASLANLCSQFQCEDLPLPVITEWVTQRQPRADMYWACGDLMGDYDGHQHTLLRAALRCIQVKIASSDGGGHVYNDILRVAFERFSVQRQFEGHVMRARCQDAIGVPANRVGDGFDRLRRAFKIAWERGLYTAAYALPTNFQWSGR